MERTGKLNQLAKNVYSQWRHGLCNLVYDQHGPYNCKPTDLEASPVSPVSPAGIQSRPPNHVSADNSLHLLGMIWDGGPLGTIRDSCLRGRWRPKPLPTETTGYAGWDWVAAKAESKTGQSRTCPTSLGGLQGPLSLWKKINARTLFGMASTPWHPEPRFLFPLEV